MDKRGRDRQITPALSIGRIFMRKTIFAASAAAGLAALALTGLHAQDAPDATAVDTSAIESGTYATDPAHSLVGWSLDHLGFNNYIGIFGDVTGTLQLDTADLTNSTVDVTIPVATITVASEGLKDHLFRPGKDGGAPDFFGPDPAPARFVSTSIEQTGPTEANITGDLTLNGVTKPVTLETTLAGSGSNMMSKKQVVGFHAHSAIKRSEWNMGWGIPFGLGDEVDLYVTVAFEK